MYLLQYQGSYFYYAVTLIVIDNFQQQALVSEFPDW